MAAPRASRPLGQARRSGRALVQVGLNPSLAERLDRVATQSASRRGTVIIAAIEEHVARAEGHRAATLEEAKRIGAAS